MCRLIPQFLEIDAARNRAGWSRPRPGLWGRRYGRFIELGTARVFRVDISVCSRCSGPMRVTRAVTAPRDIAAELRGARPPPRAAPLGQLLLFSAPTALP